MSDNTENVETTTETETTETTADDSMLSMSVEDISNMVEPPEQGETADTSNTETTDETTEDSDSSDDSDVTDDSDSTTQDTDEEAANSDSDTSDESDDGASDDQSVDDDDDDAKTSESSEESDTTDDKDDSKDLTATAVKDIEKLLSPFKANGKDIQVDNVDDAITLMRMGANYNKKMAALKPNLKIVKMLENENLLDAGKLANLIDLSKKNPAAIKQLIKDSGIDPLTLDMKEDAGYTPETYNVNDTEVELDLVLSELKDSPKFSQTMDIISNKLDASSKRILVDNPAVIRVINEHIELGIYDKIAGVVERERMLGRLTDLNDLEAYKHVSEGINANGGITADSTSSEKADNLDADTKKQVDSKEAATKARKKSAATSKSSPGKKADDNFNPLSMSDEDIENTPMSKYM